MTQLINIVNTDMTSKHGRGQKWKQTEDIAIANIISSGKIVKWGDWMGMSKLLKDRGIDGCHDIKSHMRTKQFSGEMKTLFDKLPKSAIVTATRKRKATKIVVAASNTSARVQEKAKICLVLSLVLNPVLSLVRVKAKNSANTSYDF
jgi:hypothetical protein